VFLTELTSPYNLNTQRGWHTSTFIIIIIIIVVVVVVKCYVWSIALYGAENWALRKMSEIPGKF